MTWFLMTWSRGSPARQNLALAGLVVLVYANTFDNSFHFDDHHSVERNTAIASLKSVPRYFVDGGTFSVDPDVSMYRPLLLVTYAINHAVGGAQPWSYHVVNAGLHICFVLLVFHVGRKLTGRTQAMWWASALLAVHPLNSQAVNYVSSRSGILAALGAVAAFWSVCLRQPPRPLAAGFSQLAGLLAKSTALAGLGLVAVFEAGQARSRWRAVVPLLVAAIVYVGAAWSSGFYDSALDGTVRPLYVQMLTQFKALVFYLYLVASPVHLSISHPFQVSPQATATVAAAVLLTVSLLLLAVTAWRRRQLAGFGLLWFYGGVALTTVMPLYILVSEHRLYLSLAGVAVLGACLWRPTVRFALALPTALVVCLAALTVQRNGVWQDEYGLWSDALKYNRQDARIWSGLGEAHYQRGNRDSASVYYEGALRLDPDSEVVWNNVGVLHEQAGESLLSEQAYRTALRLRPLWPEAQANLGRLLLSDGRAEEAAPLLGQAAARSPSADVLAQLGVAAARDGRRDVAEQALTQALKMQPAHVEALVNMAALHLERALETTGADTRHSQLQWVLQLSAQAMAADSGGRHAATAQLNEAAAYAALGQVGEARARYESLLAAQPDLAVAYQGYGRLLLELGDMGAADALRRAIETGAVSARAWQDLGTAEAARGRWSAATSAFESATNVAPQEPAAWYNLGEILFVQWQRASPAAKTPLQRRALQAYSQVENLAPDYRGTRQRVRQLQGQDDPR